MSAGRASPLSRALPTLPGVMGKHTTPEAQAAGWGGGPETWLLPNLFLSLGAPNLGLSVHES